MQAIRDKWKTYRSYKKVQTLWNDYKKVSHLHDNPETLKKFELFIDTMQGYLRKTGSQNSNTSRVDDVFGHCSEMMSSMIQFLNQYKNKSKTDGYPNTEKLDELLSKVLEIVEYILKDPKYRKEIQSSPLLLQSFIDLMETVDKGESSTLLIKIIILMSENLETKIEFGKQQGFKKLFDLLEKKDEETSRLILKALLHFLNLKHSKTHSQNTSQLLEELDAISKNKKDEGTTGISNKLKSIAGELRKMAFGEFDRIFSKTSLHHQDPRKMSIGDSPRYKELDDMDAKTLIYENMPTYETILAFDLSQVHRDLSLIPQDFELNPNPASEIQAEGKETVIPKEQKDTVKEFIVDQGALMALSNSLNDDKSEGDLILVSLDTLQQLLHGNKKSRGEFKKVNGYTNLSQIFFKPRDYDEIRNLQLLESAFKALKGFILDNNQATVIQDYDAFQVLLGVISGSSEPAVISHAIQCLGTILKTDWKNLVITIRMNGLGHISHLLWRSSKLKALPPDSFTIGLLSNFANMDEPLHLEEDRRNALLEIITEIFSMMSVLFGVMNIDTEIIYADFASSLLLQNDPLANYFLENLLTFIETKIQNVNVSVITLDDHLDSFIKVMTDIFHLMATSSLINTSPQYQTYFLRILAICEKILRSDHTDDVLKAEDSRGTRSDQSQSTGLGQFKNMERRSPFKTSSPSFEFNIVCKNVFAEVKSYLVFKFSEILLGEKPQFKSIFSFLDYEDVVKPEVQQRNLLTLRILKCLLLANPKLMDAFEKLNGSSLWMGVILRLYEKSGSDNKLLVELLSLLFDILVDKNNVFDILKCYSTRNLEEIPIINVNRIHLSVIEDIILKSQFDDEIAVVLDILSGLLNNGENQRIFKEHAGLNFLFNIMLNFKSTTNNFYTQTLTVFEQLITKLQPDDVDLFFETFFHPDFLKNKNLNSLFIDLLSFFSVHVALNSNPVILDKIITQEHYYSLIGLLDHSNSGILDMTLKFLNVIFTSSSRLKKNAILNKSKFTPLFIEMMKDVEPTNDLLQSVFELVFNNMDNIDILYPPNTSNVSSILNRSSIADLIIQNSNSTKQKGKPKGIPALASFEFLEVFVYLLSKCKDENMLYGLWKQFSDYMDSANIDKIADSSFIVWVAGFLEEYDLNVSVYPKFIDEILSILAKLLYNDLNKKNCRIIDILRKIEDEDNLIYAVTRKLLERISQNPVVKTDTNIFLKNLAHFFSNIDDLLGIKPEILTSMLHCINLLASKNTGEIRSAMKTQNLFEFRDNLLMQLLKFNLKSTSLYNIMKDFSFEAIANQSKFREAHIITYLIRILLTNEDYLNLQLLILRILKEDIAVNDENIKYVTKIIENPTILLYLYPDYKQKSSAVIRCFTSATANTEGRLGHDAAAGSQITPETSSEDFLRYLNSEAMEGERKQILIKTNMMLIPIENDLNKNEIKFSKKKGERKTKSQDSNAKERMNTQKFITETQLKINQKFTKNLEKFQQKHEAIISSYNTRTTEVNEALDRYISKS